MASHKEIPVQWKQDERSVTVQREKQR